MQGRARAVGAAAALVLGIAFCFVMYRWQLRYEFAFQGLAANLVLAVPFAGLAAMVLGGMSRPAAALGWLVLAVLTGLAYVSAARSSTSTAPIVFVTPFIYGTFVSSIIFAVDHILQHRKGAERPVGSP
jgi:hypothetical protein